MKHLLTAIACFFAVSMSAQAPNPDWNPDFNADSLIGSTDLLGLLSAFGLPFGGGPMLINKQYCSDVDTCDVLETTNFLVLETVIGEYNIINLPNDESWKVLLIQTDKSNFRPYFDDITPSIAGDNWGWNTVFVSFSPPRKRVVRLLRDDLGEWMPMD